ncbi:MAG: peptide chain release factor N(5)-glutamine methyltransferase [Candidatus Glassbacteria bacterium]|nr:peptide chain release factor N(5)-glutamine methyltransferase [Candidatus Glassbacteria bacterium]
MKGQPDRKLNLLEVLRRAEAYFKEHGVNAPRLSAESLLAKVLEIDRLGLYLNYDRPLVEKELAAYRELVRRRGAHEPLQYILGSWGFRGLEIAVGPDVLVPRPETEQLVELLIGLIGRTPGEKSPGARAPLRVLDLCTGSGAVGLSLAAELEGLWCLLTDKSHEALRWAVKNYRHHRKALKSPVSIYLGDLCEPLAARPFFDVVAANPPYLAPEVLSRLPREVRDYEPVEALDGGPPAGTGVIARIVETVHPVMLQGALLALEIGEDQQEPVEELFQRNMDFFHDHRFHRDLAGKLRFVAALRN